MPVMTEVMLDIETLSTRSNAVVLSIGAVKFNLTAPFELGEKFYVILDTSEQKAKGRHVSDSTLEWWSKQSGYAQEVLSTDKRVPVAEALDKLFDFLGLPGDYNIWGNGSDFDNVIVGSLIEDWGMDVPWNHWNNRCFKTLKGEFGFVADKAVFDGVKHNALDDAIHQAQWCQRIFERVNNYGLSARGRPMAKQ